MGYEQCRLGMVAGPHPRTAEGISGYVPGPLNNESFAAVTVE